MHLIRTKKRATREKLSNDLFGTTGEVAEPDDIATNKYKQCTKGVCGAHVLFLLLLPVAIKIAASDQKLRLSHGAFVALST
jgi:hypothetical protein